MARLMAISDEPPSPSGAAEPKRLQVRIGQAGPAAGMEIVDVSRIPQSRVRAIPYA